MPPSRWPPRRQAASVEAVGSEAIRDSPAIGATPEQIQTRDTFLGSSPRRTIRNRQDDCWKRLERSGSLRSAACCEPGSTLRPSVKSKLPFTFKATMPICCCSVARPSLAGVDQSLLSIFCIAILCLSRLCWINKGRSEEHTSEL